MSFTAEVKDELSRLEDRDKSAQLAQLSALMRVCGTQGQRPLLHSHSHRDRRRRAYRHQDDAQAL